MPTVEQFEKQTQQTVLLMGLAGGGKTTLAYQAEGPIAAFLLDKPVPGTLPKGMPGYDPNQIFWKSYPLPDYDLTKDAPKLPRNVADEFYWDLIKVKNALTEKKELVIGGEKWPLPRTMVIEGADFLADNIENWVLNISDKQDANDFDDRFELWRRRLKRLEQCYNLICYFPSQHLCNVVVTTGLYEESKMAANSKGKMELVKTGNIDPELGGKLRTEGPRKFANAWLCVTVAGKYFVVTKPTGPYGKFRGIRCGQFGLKDMEDVTIDVNKPVNHWQRLCQR